MSLTSQILDALPAEKEMAMNNTAIYEKCTEALDKNQVSTLLAQLYSAGKVCRADMGEGGRPRYFYWRPADIKNEQLTETIANMSKAAGNQIDSANLDLLNFKRTNRIAVHMDEIAVNDKFDIPAFLRKQPEPETITNTHTQARIPVAASLPADGAIIIEIESPGISIRLELDNGDSVFYLGSDFGSVRKILDAYQTLQQYKE